MNYAAQLNKCSKCGLCQAACPEYQESGNEMMCARAKLVILDGLAKGRLKLNDNIIKYFEPCKDCTECKGSCPAGIDIQEVFKQFFAMPG